MSTGEERLQALEQEQQALEQKFQALEQDHMQLKKTVELQTLVIQALANKEPLEKLHEKYDELLRISAPRDLL